MSYLYRTGNGRNNIAFTTTVNSSTKYLRRLGSGRTNINWYTIPAGSTYNILNRTGTGRNNIAWGNLYVPVPYPQEIQPNYVGDAKISCYRLEVVNKPKWYYGSTCIFSNEQGCWGNSDREAMVIPIYAMNGQYTHADVRKNALEFYTIHETDQGNSGSFCGSTNEDTSLNFTFKMGNYWLSINTIRYKRTHTWVDSKRLRLNYTITAVGRNYNSISNQSGQVWATYI